MRLADTPTTETEVHIDAPPSAVWPLVTEIMTPSRFGTELQEATWLEPERGPCLGARFTGRNFHPRRGEWETTSTIVEFVPEERFGSVPRSYIECTHDNAVRIGIQRQMVKMTPCKVLSLECGHTPFYSQPEELVEHLETVARS